MRNLRTPLNTGSHPAAWKGFISEAMAPTVASHFITISLGAGGNVYRFNKRWTKHSDEMIRRVMNIIDTQVIGSVGRKKLTPVERFPFFGKGETSDTKGRIVHLHFHILLGIKELPQLKAFSEREDKIIMKLGAAFQRQYGFHINVDIQPVYDRDGIVDYMSKYAGRDALRLYRRDHY